MKYLKKFTKASEYESYITSDDAILPNVSICEDEINVVHYNPYIPLIIPYLKFTAQEQNSTVSLNKIGSPSGITLQYRVNGGEWEEYTIGDVINLTSVNESVEFYGDNDHFNSSYNYYKFAMTGKISATGNIMSLMGFRDACTPYCYYNMFYDCTSLITAPSLPATTLDYRCYDCMFRGCTSLTVAPELPATTLARYCYYNMFYCCTSLTTAPSLPATTLTDTCYYGMLSNCTSLTTAPELPATKLVGSCYQSMFSGCTSLTTAPELPATKLPERCYNYMFKGCTSLTTAPELPATTLVGYCYKGMFNGCTSLTGSDQKGIRACTSRMREDLYPVLEERMAQFEADHK